LRDAVRPAEVVLVELSLLEHIARTEPASYSAAAAATDVRVQSLVEALDPTTDAIAVISDRGLDARGRDGGGDPATARVPFILAGAGVEPGSQAIAPATSIAPTLAALTGAPIPAHAQGSPVLGALRPGAALTMASAQQLTSFYELWSEVAHMPRFAADLLRQHRAGLASGDLAAYARWSAELNAAVNAATLSRLSGERAARLPFAIGVALLLLALTVLILVDRPWLALIGAGAYLVAWFILFTFVRGENPSLSLFAGVGPAPVLREFERESAILLIAISLFVALATGGHDDAFQAITTVLATLGVIALVRSAQFMWFYWQWGDTFTWTLPESSALVGAMLALTQIAALTVPVATVLPDVPLALPVAVGSAVIYGLVRRRFGRRQ
jgi:hypothetical protein